MSEHAYSTRRPRRERRQSTASGIPGLNQTRRSWTTPGGMHCTFEATTYTSPGFALNFGGGHTGTSIQDSQRPNRSSTLPTIGGGLIGGALNLLDGLVSAQRQRYQRHDAPRLDGRSRHMPHVKEPEETDFEEYLEDGLAYGTTSRSNGRPRSMLGKLRDRLLEGTRPRVGQNDDLSDRPQAQRRQTDGQYVRPQPYSNGYAQDPSPRQRSSRDTQRGFTNSSNGNARNHGDTAETEPLHRDIERKRRRYLEAKSRFQRASQRTMIDSVYLRNLLDEVQLQERSLARAEQRLRDHQASHPSSRPRAVPQERTRPSMSRQSSARTESEYDEDGDEDEEEEWHHPGFGTFFNAPRDRDPMFPVFDDFDDFDAFDPFGHHRAFNRLFAQMSGGGLAFHDGTDGFHFHAMPGDDTVPKRPRFSAGGRRTSYQQQPFAPNPAASSRAAPPRPSNALRAEEAVRLFETYNTRWLALAPTSPDIPYPTRTLQAEALSDPSTLPHAAAHVFSNDRVMQANVQIFFLLASGIKPEISDVGIVSFNRYEVGEAKVKELVEVLKKEKVRWHSDRLGRRNGGSGNVNEALQRDERARAVFHGVCALMVYAVERA